MGLRIETESRGKALLLKLDGIVDASTAPEFSRVLRENIGMGHAGLVLDLSRVQYVSSAFLGALYSKQQDARDAHGEIILAAPNTDVRDVLDQVNMGSVLKIKGSVADAVQALSVE